MNEALNACLLIQPWTEYFIVRPVENRLRAALYGAFEDFADLCCLPDRVQRTRLIAAHDVPTRLREAMAISHQMGEHAAARYGGYHFVTSFVSRVLTGRGQKLPVLPGERQHGLLADFERR